MATRTVRLDDEAERALDDVRALTGLPISEVLKRGVHALRKEVRASAGRTPYDVYQGLDVGAGGEAAGPATDVRGTLRRVLRKKHGR